MPKAKPLAEIKKFNARNQESARQKIKITKLIQRLQDFAMATPYKTEDGDTEYWSEDGKRKVAGMTKEQITAASKVIDKALPNITKLESEHTENKVHSISQDTLLAIENLTQQAREKVIEGEYEEI